MMVWISFDFVHCTIEDVLSSINQTMQFPRHTVSNEKCSDLIVFEHAAMTSLHLRPGGMNIDHFVCIALLFANHKSRCFNGRGDYIRSPFRWIFADGSSA